MMIEKSRIIKEKMVSDIKVILSRLEKIRKRAKIPIYAR